jgi:hypothetical protein
MSSAAARRRNIVQNQKGLPMRVLTRKAGEAFIVGSTVKEAP